MRRLLLRRRLHLQTKWCSMAKRVAAAREVTSSLPKIERRWTLTVLGLMISSAC